MKREKQFVDVVCKLVDAVIFEHCTIEGSERYDSTEGTVNSALAVLKEIRAAKEFSSLHKWVDRQLAVHADAP